jgi:hypothetical protein
MQSIQSSPFLRLVLTVDAVSCAVMGASLLLFSAQLAPLFELPADLLREAGWVLIPFAAFLGYLASRRQAPRALVWAVIALNAVWVLDSILLLLTGWVAPNAWGYGFVILQAAAVGVLAELEYIGLRNSRPALAA